MPNAWTTRRMQRVFGLEAHQLRHLLTTFTPGCIAREYLVPQSDVSFLRMQLGLPRFPNRRRHGFNGHPGTSAWRTPDLRAAGAPGACA